MKEFTTAIERAQAEAEDEDDVLEFAVNEENAKGEVTGTQMCKAYYPGGGQLAVLMATTTKHSSLQEQVAGVINFFASVLDDDSHSYIVGRLLDRKDPFGIEQVQGIMEWLVAEWTGRPTKPPSGSTQSRSNGGQRSTEATPALT